MIDPVTKEAFWTVVEQSLARFFLDGNVREARNKTRQARAAIERTPENLPNEMVYHSDPFDVACDLADREVMLKDVWPDYLQIIQAQRW